MLTDEKSIRQTISYYSNGGTNGDPALVAKAFHPTATMKFIKDYVMIDVPIEKYFSDYIKAGQVQERTTEIEYIQINGTAAQAKIILDYSTYQFIDFFNLLKIDGAWLIVSKIFHRENKKT